MARYRRVTFDGDGDEWRRAWLEYRNHGIGGSDAPAVLGMSPYSSPYTVWLEKTGRVAPKDLSEVESVYWGTQLEDVVAQEYAKRHPDTHVRRARCVFESIERPWQFATVDRTLRTPDGKRGVLEIKTCGARRAHDWDFGMPDYYIAQPTHYLAVTGYDFFDVAVLIGGQEYREFHYGRDLDDIGSLVERETAFWEEYVEKDVPPMLTGMDCDTEAVRMQFPTDDGEFLEMVDEDLPDVAKCIAKRELARQYEREAREIENQLKQIIGNSRGIITPNRRITWVRSSYTAFDRKALQEEQPEVYERYCETRERDGGVRIREKER